MLVELTVENYAVVEKARVQFHAGFNLLTGETGSGKSIIVDALGLLLGGRASADMIRTGSARARVSGIFEVDGFAHPEVTLEDGELLIEREILASGKSRAFINSRPVTAALLKTIAPLVCDIHGQHEQQMLFEPAVQRDMLDRFGGHEVLRSRMQTAQRAWSEVRRELDEIERSAQERLRMADLWSFQKREIESAAPKPDEDAKLEHERRLLANVTKIATLASEAYASLHEAEASATALLRTGLKRLEELARIDESFRETVEALRSAEIAVAEASHTLRDYLGRLEADPARLEEVEGRLATLDRLKRKYGPTLADTLAYLESISVSLDAATTAEDRAEKLTGRLASLDLEASAAAADLRAAREKAAVRLSKAVEAELSPLAMAGARLVIAIRETTRTGDGADEIEFLMTPNAGETPRPIDKVLSGGELSRLALALQCVVSNGSPGRTLVFDEVDAGIGGAVAEAVGRRLKSIAARDQVLCVTHLAQIAAFGDHHYRVDKAEVKDRTVATVTELDHAQRVREIGRMLAGERLTAEALKHAEQLLTVLSAPA